MDQLRVPATPSSSLLPIPESASNNHNTYQNQEIIIIAVLRVPGFWFIFIWDPYCLYLVVYVSLLKIFHQLKI